MTDNDKQFEKIKANIENDLKTKEQVDIIDDFAWLTFEHDLLNKQNHELVIMQLANQKYSFVKERQINGLLDIIQRIATYLTISEKEQGEHIKCFEKLRSILKETEQVLNDTNYKQALKDLIMVLEEEKKHMEESGNNE